MTYRMIHRTTTDHESLEELSAAYSKARDNSGEGASTWPFATVTQNGEPFAIVSYNGKVWRNAESYKTEKPLYNPYI